MSVKFDMLDYADLIHSGIGDCQVDLQRIADASERIATVLEKVAATIDGGYLKNLEHLADIAETISRIEDKES